MAGGAVETVRVRTTTPIWFVIILALAIRIAFPILVGALTKNPKVFHSSDTEIYLNAAICLAKAGRFVTSLESPAPEIIWTPGYPIFLLPAIMVGKVEVLVISMQIFVSCLTAYLVYRIALMLFVENSIAFLCALLYAIEPMSVIFTSLIMTETLFTCLLTAGVFFLLRFLQRGTRSDLLISGFAVSLCAFVRPISALLPLWSAMVLLIAGRIKRMDRIQLLKLVAVFVTVSMTPILVWQARNRIETSYSGFSAMYDLNLYWGIGATIRAKLQGKTAHQQQLDMGFKNWDKYFTQHPDQRLWSRENILRYWRSEAIKTILREPICFLTLYLESQVKFLLAPGATEFLGLFGATRSFQSREFAVDPDALLAGKGIIGRQLVYAEHWPIFFWTGAILGLLLFAYLLLAAIAVFSKKFFTLPTIVVSGIAIYFMLVTFDVGSPYRFRLPIMPIVCLFSGYGLSLVVGRFKHRRIVG